MLMPLTQSSRILLEAPVLAVMQVQAKRGFIEPPMVSFLRGLPWFNITGHF